jgi:hypothetical protein
VSFIAITICVASRVFAVVYFVIDSIRKLLDIPSYCVLRIFFLYFGAVFKALFL